MCRVHPSCVSQNVWLCSSANFGFQFNGPKDAVNNYVTVITNNFIDYFRSDFPPEDSPKFDSTPRCRTLDMLRVLQLSNEYFPNPSNFFVHYVFYYAFATRLLKPTSQADWNLDYNDVMNQGSALDLSIVKLTMGLITCFLCDNKENKIWAL